ncbi:MAG: hypothetical protein PHV30_11430 [Candidatus Margulisbacteria bacterium]|nr:hypothetical protein [Candidatus Margulisiibacteriota bacterium]
MKTKILSLEIEALFAAFQEKAQECRTRVKEAFKAAITPDRKFCCEEPPEEFFAKTIDWIVDFAPSFEALEKITEALIAIAPLEKSLNHSREIRRFIKFSRSPVYDHIPSIIALAELIKQIGDFAKSKPLNDRQTMDLWGILDMDFLYFQCEMQGPYNIQKRSKDKAFFQKELVNYINRQELEVMEILKNLKEFLAKLLYGEVIEITPEAEVRQLT